MPNTKTFSRSFGGGEIASEMFGRIDDAKFQSGAAVLKNFIALPQGPAVNRAGLAYVNITKNQAFGGIARLIPFTYSQSQTMVIEMGSGYMRFHTQGATLVINPALAPAYVPSQVVTFTAATPTVITWPAHGLQNLSPVRFQNFSGSQPGGIDGSHTYTAEVIDANTLNISYSLGSGIIGASSTGSNVRGGVQYNQGDLVQAAGRAYYRKVTVPDIDGINEPIPDFNWYPEPVDFTYEIPSPYSFPAEIFAVHYVQSADVMTLVHPNRAPVELRRNGATNWSLNNIQFGAAVGTPDGVAVAASPGYLAQIASITLASPALITTAANHTLALGDGIYINGLIATTPGGPIDLTGFYLVNLVPADVDGNLIPNELEVMDYNGNVLDASAWTGYSLSPGTIQLGDKIFNITNSYAVSAISADGVTQSVLSSPASATNNLNVPGSYNTVTWDAVDGASLYYIFKQENGLWGYIGQASGTSFIDNNIAPDFSITPVNLQLPFGTADNFPAAVGYVEQRRCFAGTNNNPQTLWMTNSGTESTFSYSLPSLDTDRIQVKVASREVSSIEHIVPMTSLILLTNSCEYAEYTTSGGPITPSSIGIRPQSYVGASNVQPNVVNNSIVYAASRGGHVRELIYNLQQSGFVTNDLSLRAIHLFDTFTIVDQAFSKAPWPIVWFVSSNGNLLGLTYAPEQEIGAWHHHVTSGAFESVTCVAEGNEDFLYAVVRRVINGQTVRYVERMASRLIDPTNLPACFFVDSGATFTSDSGPVTTISGLTWLEGETVAVLADGSVQNQKVVTDGAITLDQAATVVQVGIPYVSDLQTLPPVLQVDGFAQGRQMNLNQAWIRVYQSSGIFAGPDEDSLVEFQQRTDEPYGSPPELRTGQAGIVLSPDWNDEGQLLIRQSNPLPLTVVAVTLEMSVGG